MSELSSQLLEAFDNEYGAIAFNFMVTQTPAGSAPDPIKEQWIGVALPIREKNLGGLATRYLDLLSGEFINNDTPVSATGWESILALEQAGKLEARDFWAPYRYGLFTFRAYEGTFQAVEE